LQGLAFKGEWQIPFHKDYSIEPTPIVIHNFIRAMQPWPQAWTLLRLNPKDKEPKRLKILKSHLQPTSTAGQTSLTTHNPQLILDEVQLEGKDPVSWKQFTTGYPNAIFE
jgi:methionyl-tRNA formyltransferase